MEEDNPIITTIKFFPVHLQHLKTVDANVSNATRKLIEKDINQNKTLFLEKYMMLFAIGLVVIALAVPIFSFALLITIGVVILIYSIMRIFLWRVNREMAARTR